MFRTRPAVPHASPPTPCPMHSDHAPNIFRTFSEYTPLISGLPAALVWLGARGCHHGGALLGVVSRVCGGPQPRLRRPSATTPVILGPSGTSRSRQATCVALLVMRLFEADGRGVRPGPSLLEVLEVRRPRRHVEGHLGEGRSGIEAAVQAQENEARASSQKACSGHTWLSRFLRVSVSWQGQRAEGNSNDDRGVVGDDLLAGIGDAPACSSFHPGRRGPQERVTIC